MSGSTVAYPIQKDFENCRNKFGMVDAPDLLPGGNSGVKSSTNNLFHSDYVLLLDLRGQLDLVERKRSILIYDKLQETPGLLMRMPDDPEKYDYQSGDDIAGALNAGRILENNFARDFLDHGRNKRPLYIDRRYQYKRTNIIFSYIIFYFFKFLGKGVPYSYNTKDKTGFATAAWMGRRQELIAMAQMIVGEEIPLWRRAWWVIAILMTVIFNPTDQDGRALSRHLLYTFKETIAEDTVDDMIGKIKLGQKDKHPFMLAAVHHWFRSYKKEWAPGYFGEVRGRYWKKHDYNPMKKWAWGLK